VDGTSLAYRAYYAFIKNPLVNSKGMNTSAPFAFTNSLIKLIRELKPTHIAVIFDAKGKTFRHMEYEQYKAQRPKAPSDFVEQLIWIKKIVEAMNITIFEIPGVEADDVIATITKMAHKEGFEVMISTSDKDLLQLVDEKIKVIDTRPKTTILYDYNEVVKKFGVPPQKIPDMLALIGDSIDNIPGVPGIGEKTAREIIAKYGDIQNLLKHTEGREDRIARLIKQYRQNIELALELVKLRDDLDIKFNLENLQIREWDKKKLFIIFKELEFYSLMRELASYPIYSIKETSHLPLELLKGTALEVKNNRVYLSATGNDVYVIPVENARELLTNKSVEKWSFDSKETYKALMDKNIDATINFDISIATYLIESDKPRYDPDSLILESLGWKLNEDGEKRIMDITVAVARMKPELEITLKNMELYDLYKEIELPLQKVLAKMEKRGVYIDKDHLQKLLKNIDEKLEKIRKEIYKQAGTEFNINSPKQLQEVLFEKLKLKPVKKTKTGYSTDQEVLEKLSLVHPVPKLILDYRELYKIKSTYLESLIKLIDPETGRIYPTFNQTGTATGRLSCQNPNFQNIPIRSEIGREVRRAIIAPPGYIILSADYSQIELRILAHMTQDENLLNVFREGHDIHRKTASLIFNKPEEKITDIERRKAKTVNFGISYGISPYGLSKELNISVEEAHTLIENFFLNFPRVREWVEKTVREAEDNGFIRTLSGRIRYVPQLKSKNQNIREFGKRIAINSPIQGTAADLIKKAMVEIDKELTGKNLHSYLILQIHDELVLEVKQDEVDLTKEIVKEKMENALKLSVPIEVNIGVGRNWLEAHG